MKEMKHLIYKRSIKILLAAVQAVVFGVLCYCLLNIGFWMEDSDGLWEAAGSYEETSLFFRQVDIVLRHKIRGQQNSGLFETDGEFDGKKEIDIQSFGQPKVSVKDLNTTYFLEDLLSFCESGKRQELHDAIRQAMGEGNSNDQEAGEKLDAQSDVLETILPVTGIPLSECSRWYSNPAGFVLDMYRKLDEVCIEIEARYTEYQTKQEESWSSEAPSNLRYCIENTATGELFTNLDGESYDEAYEALKKETEFVCLYEGERSFNIMVANPDNVLNEKAGQWFLNERFVNTNERVLLAVDLKWPVSDELQTYANFFVKRGDILLAAGITSVLCIAVLVFCFVLTMMGTGWQEGRQGIRLSRLDEVPTELMMAIYAIFGAVFLIVVVYLIPESNSIFDSNRNSMSLAASVGYLIFLSACASFMRRLHGRTLWSNSICYMLVKSWKQVTSTRLLSGRFLVIYIGFFALNLLFLLLFRRVGVFLVLVLDMVALLYLLRDLVGKKSVWEGIHQISRGDLTYKIDTTTLQGETYEMARAINEMGDGLQEAVQAIIKNERLKADLITNVSHDLKTPLTSIVNYVDLLKRENPEGERVRHYIEILEQKSQRLKQLTEDLVEASRISSGNVELDMIELPLAGILEQAYGEFQERFEERGLKTVWKLEDHPLNITADGSQLWRVLENLMGNIYKYAMEGTNLYIELTGKEGKAYLSFQNISAQEITVEADELTGRFVRGDKSRSTEGSGLGLSIAQNLTQLMGGEFRLQTEGNLFQVILSFPLTDAED